MDPLKEIRKKIEFLRHASNDLDKIIQDMKKDLTIDNKLDYEKINNYSIEFQLRLEQEELTELSSIIYEEMNRTYILCSMTITPTNRHLLVIISLSLYEQILVELVQKKFDIRHNELVRDIIAFVAIEEAIRSYERIKRWLKKKEIEDIALVEDKSKDYLLQ
jgi:hypothetical protein